jgi:hypothetical protein
MIFWNIWKCCITLHAQQLILSHLLRVAINRIDYSTVKYAVNFASYPVVWVL